MATWRNPERGGIEESGVGSVECEGPSRQLAKKGNAARGAKWMDHAQRTATLDDGLGWSGCSRRE